MGITSCEVFPYVFLTLDMSNTKKKQTKKSQNKYFIFFCNNTQLVWILTVRHSHSSAWNEKCFSDKNQKLNHLSYLMYIQRSTDTHESETGVEWKHGSTSAIMFIITLIFGVSHIRHAGRRRRLNITLLMMINISEFWRMIHISLIHTHTHK